MNRITYRVLHEEWTAHLIEPHYGETGRGIEVSGPGDSWTLTIAESTVADGALLLRMFDDAFPAFAEIPAFFADLAAWRIRTLDDVLGVLSHMEAVDVTPREGAASPR